MIKFKSITIDGFRTLKNFKLDLDGLHVLIGENGSGKSTVVEAFEIYRRFWSREFWNEFHKIHGGYRALFRDRESGSLLLEMEYFGSGIATIQHRVVFDEYGNSEHFHFKSKSVDSDIEEFEVRRHIDRIEATLNGIDFAIAGLAKVDVHRSLMVEFLRPDSSIPPIVWLAVGELDRAIELIDVQLPFQTGCFWGSQSIGSRVSPMRDSVIVVPSPKLDRFGANLPNVFHSIREASSDDEWLETMELVRAGLGDWFERVSTPADAGGGRIGLSIKVRGRDQKIPAYTLSDGQLNYLAFVALARAKTERSILVFDEIDLHLHPSMIGRVMSLMKMIAKHTPVLLTTHSRMVLNTLDDPAKQITVLELDPTNFTTDARQYNEESLKLWLERYESVSAVLDSGNEKLLFEQPDGAGVNS